MATSGGFLKRLFGGGKQDGAVGSCCGVVNIVPDEDLLEDDAQEKVESKAPAAAAQNPASAAGGPEVLVITGSCCSPMAKPFDERALRAAQDVIAETGAPATFRTISATAGMNGALSKEVLDDLTERQRNDGLQLPVLMVGGEVIAGGLIKPEHVREGLVKAGALAQGQPVGN